MNKQNVVEEIVFPPQSSIELESHGAGNERYPLYYTWKIKVYCDDLNAGLSQVELLDKQLKEKYHKQ